MTEEEEEEEEEEEKRKHRSALRALKNIRIINSQGNKGFNVAYSSHFST